MLARISAAVTNGNWFVGMLSLSGITRGRAYAPCGALTLGRAYAPWGGSRLVCRRAHGAQQPGLPRVAVERERPALREPGGAGLAAGEDLRGVAVLEVAAAVQLDLDRHRRRLSARVEPGDADLLDLRTPDHEAGGLARGARVQEVPDRLPVRDRAQARVVTVHRLGPCGRRASRGHLEHVGGEAAVGQAQVERGGASVAGEVEVRDLGNLHRLGDCVRDGAFDQRLVAHALVVGLGAGDDVLLEDVRALGALLDGRDDPALVRVTP